MRATASEPGLGDTSRDAYVLHQMAHRDAAPMARKRPFRVRSGLHPDSSYYRARYDRVAQIFESTQNDPPFPDSFTALQERAAYRGRFGTASPPSYLDSAQALSACIPGPGQYSRVGDSLATTVIGGQISRSTGKSDVERMIQDASLIPGPGQYCLPAMGDARVAGFKMAKSQAKNYIEEAIHRNKHVPGPGQYLASVTQSTRAGLIR